ncbi:MAG: DUF1499 domain-containing protein [Halioglobus sp.]|nr:DUF1499 domain-containing protein [Halioglobus sp.]
MESSSSNAPRLVNWTGYLSLAMLLILPVSVLAARTGAWQPALLIYAVAIVGSTLLILVAIVLLVMPRMAAWRTNITLNMLFAFPGTLLFITMLNAGDYPAIHDITTDTDEPPLFVMAEKVRGPDSNTLDIKPDSILQQINAYPGLAGLESSLAPGAAFDRALVVARELEWEIYHEDRNAGIIEAVDTTSFMAFKDDVVIRIRPLQSGSLLDLRSVSRVGKGDVGANAKRIDAFIAAFPGS